MILLVKSYWRAGKSGRHNLLNMRTRLKANIKKIIQKIHPKNVVLLFDTFLKDESIGGKIILAAAILSLLVVNSPLRDEFYRFWQIPITAGLGDAKITLDLKHWVNEGLMAFFFLVVGLEIKRELIKGELKNRKTAILPIGAAVGGMAFPALIYLLFNVNTDAAQGWGIPIATDIAFAVAVISLLNNRTPVSLKIFLLTLAIADDIGAIFIITLFYAEMINYWYLGASFLLAVSVFIFRNRLTNKIGLVSLTGTVLWVMIHFSGIHASIVGAIMGLLAPISDSKTKMAVAEKVERFFIPITTYFVLPVFAFANAGFTITTNALTTNLPVLAGVFFGLVIGKVVGITITCWLLIKLNVAQLPNDMVRKHIFGVGFISGIGFTVSIFITELAFSDNQQLSETAKTGIFLASAVSALLGYITLRTIRPGSR